MDIREIINDAVLQPVCDSLALKCCHLSQSSLERGEKENSMREINQLVIKKWQEEDRFQRINSLLTLI